MNLSEWLVVCKKCNHLPQTFFITPGMGCQCNDENVQEENPDDYLQGTDGDL